MRMCVRECACVHMCVRVCACMRAYMCMSMLACLCVYVPVYVYIRTYVCTYVRACSGTHYVSFICACEHFASLNTSACMRQIYNEVNLRPRTVDWRSMALSVT